MNRFPEFIENNWLLRIFKDEDISLVKEASSDPFIPLITTIPKLYSEANALEYINRQKNRHIEKKGYSFALIDLEKKLAIGSVFLGLIDGDAERATLGYWLIKEYRGRKIIPQILPKVINWAFDELGIIRLELYAEKWNKASINIAQSLGFKNEGLLRSWQKVGDVRKDMFMFSLIKKHKL